jgi:hypothetical protein
MTQYFIIVDSTQPKNNLDKALQSSFEPFEHKLIGEEQLYILELTYRAALLGYQSGGGRCSVPGYKQWKLDGIVCFIKMGETLSLKLIRVNGIVSDTPHAPSPMPQ